MIREGRGTFVCRIQIRLGVHGCPAARPTSHDLILCQAAHLFLALHGVGAIWILVFYIGQAERTSTVLITSEFG